MRGFWWFIDGRLGGMGRLGFNQAHWFDLSPEEGILLSWLGKQADATPLVASLWAYLEQYGPRVAPFYRLSTAEIHDRLRRLRDQGALRTTLEQLNAKAGVFQEVSWLETDAQVVLCCTPNTQRVQDEVALLQQHNISVVISLLEHPLDHGLLDGIFEVHHVPVEDAAPPNRDQVYAVAHTLDTALTAGKNVVIHCLAGIGRTTTMLIAAYLVQGYSLAELVAWVQARNPHFQFIGCQVAFLQALADDVAHGRAPLIVPTGGQRRLCP
jgi:protein-tyrosine phosphatase